MTARLKEKVLITGGAGFIGSALIKTWLREDAGVHLVNLDKLTYCGDLSRLKGLEKDPRYQFFKGDVCCEKEAADALEGCSAVVHLAAETHVDRSLLEAKTFFDTNLYGTYTLLELARKKGIKKFLYVSTDEVYGSREKGVFREGDALEPTSPYSVSKAAADLLVLSYAKVHGMHTVVTRGSNTYGPFQYPEKVIPLFASNAVENKKLPLYGDGRQVRNWMFVDDHCRAIMTVFRRGKKGETYNVSTSADLTNIELTGEILRVLKKPRSLIQRVTDRVGHDRRYSVSSAKLRRLGWKETRDLKEALEETVLWYLENKDWWRAIKDKKDDFKKYYALAYAGRS